MKSIWASLFFTAAMLSAKAAEQVYIACGKMGVRMASFDAETGTLSETSEALNATGVGFLALHPEQDVLYTTYQTDGKKGENGAIAACQILDSGTLDVLNLSPTQHGGACHVSVDATGQVVFAANYGQGTVISYQVEDKGALSDPVSVIQHEGGAKVVGTRQNGPHAHNCTVGPQNKFAYVPDLGLDAVKIYRFDQKSAELTAAGEAPVAPGGGPRHMKFSKDGRFAYVLNELNLTVTTFEYNAESGLLTAVDSVSTVAEGTDPAKMSCAEIRVHPNGKFVYTSQRDLNTRGADKALGRNSLSVYRVTGEGTLQRVQTLSACVKIPRNFNLHPSGKWLLAGGQASQNVQVFAVDEKTGKLSAQGDPVECPGEPMCFVFR